MEDPIISIDIKEHSEHSEDTLRMKEDNSKGGNFLDGSAVQDGMKQTVKNNEGCEKNDEELMLPRNFISNATECTLLNSQTYSHSQLEGPVYNSISHSNWNLPTSNLQQNNQSLLFSYNWYNGWMNHSYEMNPEPFPYGIQLDEYQVFHKNSCESNLNDFSVPLGSEVGKEVNHFQAYGKSFNCKSSESLTSVAQDAGGGEDIRVNFWCDSVDSKSESKSTFTSKYFNSMRQNNDKVDENEVLNNVQVECRKSNDKLNYCDKFHNSLSFEKSENLMISSASQSLKCPKLKNMEVPEKNSYLAADTLAQMGSKADVEVTDKITCDKIHGDSQFVKDSNCYGESSDVHSKSLGVSPLFQHYKQALKSNDSVSTENKCETLNSTAEGNSKILATKCKNMKVDDTCWSYDGRNMKKISPDLRSVSLQKKGGPRDSCGPIPQQYENSSGCHNTAGCIVNGQIAITNTDKSASAENLSLVRTIRTSICDNSEISSTKNNSGGQFGESFLHHNLRILNRKSTQETDLQKSNLKETLFTPSDRTNHRSSSRMSLSKAQQAERTRNHISYLLNKLPELAKCFDIHKKVGEGTFSSVFLGTLKPEVMPQMPEFHSRKYAIKHLIPTILPKRVARELKFLHQIGGKDNVIGVDLSVRKGDCCVFVMPYLPHGKFIDYVLDMDAEETRDYMRNLMIALKRVHSFNVIHRDVKPSNFLYCRERKKYLLVDFGLSQTVSPHVKRTANERAKKRKRQEEFFSEGVKCDGEISARSARSDSKMKVIALQQRTQEDSNILKHNVISQPLKRQRLTDSGSRSQKMIAYLQQENSSMENKRAPLTPKVSNKKNIISSQTFKLPYSSPKVLQKELSIRKKLFASNNENDVPKSCSTSKLDSPKAILSSPLTSKKFNSQPQLPTPKSVSGNADAHSPMGPALSNESSKQKFQTLVPTPDKDGNCGQTIVRVQNSQVKSQVLKPLSPLESENQRKLLSKKQTIKKHSPSSKNPKCFCKGLPQVCRTCLKQKPIPAPRAGTPGFRPPEVLLKYPLQTTAVDMWAAGVIMLCILSGCYPFFRSPDDITALAEIMTVFGTDNIQSVARRLGRIVSTSDKKLPLDLRKLCERLRRRRKDVVAGLPDSSDSLPLCSKCENTIDSDGCLCPKEDSSVQVIGEFPLSAYDLLKKLLDLNPATRITAEEALQHPFLKGE